MTQPATYRLPPAYYAARLSEFLSSDDDLVLGRMAKVGQFDLVLNQRDAWLQEFAILRSSLVGLDGMIFLEFDVPRLGSRIDAVLISGPAVFPIEFKVGEDVYRREHHNQAWDYALDLKNFHRGSHSAPIFPVLLATEAVSGDCIWGDPHSDGVYPPAHANPAGLRSLVDRALTLVGGPSLDGEQWGAAPYHPTPTIIEAAQSLYSRHTVEAIIRNDAGATNLSVTSARVEQIVEDAQARTRTRIP